MGVFTQVASNIKWFARKFARKSVNASCVNGAQGRAAESGVAKLRHPAMVLSFVTEPRVQQNHHAVAVRENPALPGPVRRPGGLQAALPEVC